MHKIRVGVLRGGNKENYKKSLLTGSTVLKSLSTEKYHARDVLIDHDGNWHLGGIKMAPGEITHFIDVVFNSLYGYKGENFEIQNILEHAKIPFTGNGLFNSSIVSNKLHLKRTLDQNSLLSSDYILVEDKDYLDLNFYKLYKTFSPPIILRSINTLKNEHVYTVKTSGDFKKYSDILLENSGSFMIEEVIYGKHFSCYVINDFRDQKYYALPPHEIVLKEGLSSYAFPIDADFILKTRIEDEARNVHKTLGLDHFSKINFIMHPRRGLFVKDIDTHPEIAQNGELIDSLNYVGSNLELFVDHLATMGLNRFKFNV